MLFRLRDTVWGVFRDQNVITRSAHFHQTTATEDGAQIERHLVRTQSIGTVCRGRSNFVNLNQNLINRERRAIVQIESF